MPHKEELFSFHSKRKKRPPLLLCLVSFFVFLLFSANVCCSQTLVVQKNLVNIRTLPSVTAAIVMRVSEGHRLQSLAHVGDWYQVRLDGEAPGTGWVYHTLVRVAEGDPTSPKETIVARMGDVTLSRFEVQDLLQLMADSMSSRLPKNRSALQELIKEEVVRKKMLIHALEEDLAASPKMQRLLARSRTQALADRYLLERALPAVDYPSVSLLFEAYQKQQERFTTSPAYHLVQLLYVVPKGADEQQKERMYERANKDYQRFTIVSDAFSASESNGGAGLRDDLKIHDLGWLEAASLQDDLKTIAAGLTKGGVSAPYQSAAGWSLFRLVDRRDGGVLPFAEVQKILRQEMRQQRFREKRNHYLQQLITNNPIQLDETVVKDLPL